MVTSRISEWNSLERSLVLLYTKLADLGMEYGEDGVYLVDLEREDV